LRKIWRNPSGSFGLASVGVILFVLLARPLAPSWPHALLGGAVIWASLLPALLFHRLPDSRHPVFPVSGIFYAVCFGLPVFLVEIIWPENGPLAFQRHYYETRRDFISLECLSLVLTGLLAYVGVFASIRRWLSALSPVALRLPRPEGGWRLHLMLGVLLALHLADIFSPAVHELPSLGQFARPAGYLVFAMYLQLALRGRLAWWATGLVFGVLFPIVIIKTLAGGLLTAIILYFLLLFLVAWPIRPRLSAAAAGMLAVLTVFSYDLLNNYRGVTWQHREEAVPYAAKPTLFKAALFADMLVDSVFGMTIYFDLEALGVSPGHGISVRTAENFARRISLAPVLSHVMEKTPNDIPYWQGETYAPLLTSGIPRVLWADKPEERLGGEFGVRYGFIAPDRGTSINVPWITELFINFGSFGVVLGMGVIGLLMAAADRIFNSTGMAPLEAITGLTLIFPFAYPESNFSVMWGSFPLLFLSLFLYFRIGGAVLARLGPDARSGASPSS
jgi:hypothetical protein